MTILLDFIKILNTKTKNYTDVWIQILSCIEEKEKVSVFQIISKKSINLKTFYRVFNFGTKYLIQNNFEYSFFLENNSIIIKKTSDITGKYFSKKQKLINSDKISVKRKTTPKKAKNQDKIDLIIGKLNQKTLKRFNPTSKINQKIINERISEGFELEDFYKVIDLKVQDWLGKETLEKNIRPDILFGEKMEYYVLEKLKQKLKFNNNRPSIEQNYEAAQQAKSTFNKNR